MAAVLTFDADSHTYRVGGVVRPSVTQVLDSVLRQYDRVCWETMEAARDFGRNVHTACHLWNLGKLDLDDLDPYLLPYLNGWRNFLRDTGFQVLASETPLYHKRLGYAGTPDVAGYWQKCSWVLDWKSGVVPWTVGAQTAGYQEMLDPKPKRRLCLQLTGEPGLGYKAIEQKDPRDWARFQSALVVYQWQNERKPTDVSQYA